jgi:putative copper export protein
MDSFVTWLVRYVHVLGAALWIGGYALMALVVLPALARDESESLRRLALGTARMLTFAGTLTILGGLLLVARSRGYESLLGGEWGGTVIGSVVLAVVMMGIGDAGLRPAIQRIGPGTEGNVRAARRWALAGLVIGIIALGLMTRALYARG